MPHLHICEECRTRYLCPSPEWCDGETQDGLCLTCWEQIPPEHEVEDPRL